MGSPDVWCLCCGQPAVLIWDSLDELRPIVACRNPVLPPCGHHRGCGTRVAGTRSSSEAHEVAVRQFRAYGIEVI